ncbi:MAG: thioesterase [Thermoprotei archaeon]|nr:MAG: thioesterase [Thermoprotei archaeon]RLE56778.1 MAG: thioesterase [Thermoprotei archaeon]
MCSSTELKPGLKNVITKVVGPDHIAEFLGSGGVPVLATPMMIAWMEECAKLLVDNYLSPGQVTVGTRVDVVHKAPAKVGTKVTVEAELVEVSGRRLLFKVRAYSGDVVIGEGTHERYIVDLEKFKARTEELSKRMEFETPR